MVLLQNDREKDILFGVEILGSNMIVREESVDHFIFRKRQPAVQVLNLIQRRTVSSPTEPLSKLVPPTPMNADKDGDGLDGGVEVPGEVGTGDAFLKFVQLGLRVDLADGPHPNAP